MAQGNGPPLSLRPFPVADKKPKNIGEFITRVNAQPGGFRALAESSLRQDAALSQQQSKDGTEDGDVEMSDGDGAEGDEEDVAQDITQARMEVLKHIEQASHTAMVTLESLSLLLSKQNPTQASLTLSRGLREMTGIGTLGADKLDEPDTTELNEKDQEDTAIGWTLMEIDHARDSAEAACSFLEKEVESEGRYWDDVIGVQKNGWSVSKMPQERHTLGVRFGFSEAAPEFKQNGLAPMRRGQDGRVILDNGRLGGVSERLVITCEKDGKLVGRSALPALTDDTASLEERVLEARNTLFSQELWHELNREARTLASYDVRVQGSRLNCAIDKNTKISVELVALDAEPSSDSDLPDSNVAEAISLSLHIMLSYAHRLNELMRIRPIPPNIQRAGAGQHSYALLRPVLARNSYIRNTYACTRYIGGLVRTLKRAGLESSFVLQTIQPSFPDTLAQGPNQPAASQALIRNLLPQNDFLINVTLLPDVRLTVRGRTYMFPVTATHFHILLPQASLLDSICPPHKNGYPDVDTLADYLRTATARLLTNHLLDKISANQSGEWTLGIRGNSIQNADQGGRGLRVSIEDGEEEEGSSSSETAQKYPTLIAVGASVVEGKPQNQQWTWRPDGGEDKSLLEAVGKVVNHTLS